MSGDTYIEKPEGSAVSRPTGRDVFGLSNGAAYAAWREKKLLNYPRSLVDHIVEIADPSAPSPEEKAKITNLCTIANAALYSVAEELNEKHVMRLATAFGLRQPDVPLFTGQSGVTAVTQISEGRQGEYAPYTNRSLSWHTDGYYNPPGAEICSMLMHCKSPAGDGGSSAFLDPEIAYLMLRDENPEYIQSLLQPDAFTIHANIEGGKLIRPAQTGPVFSVIEGHLHMRYSARKRYVEWKQDPMLDKARACLTEIMDDPNGPANHLTLSKGQGIICNNVLHKRTAYKENQAAPRLLYRARFTNRVSSSTI